MITHELRTVIAELGEGDAVFAERAEKRVEVRGERLDARAQQLDMRERRLSTREQQLTAVEQRIRAEVLHRGPSQERPKSAAMNGARVARA